MEICNATQFQVQARFGNPDLDPDLVVGQVVAKVLGHWSVQGRWELLWDQPLPFFLEDQPTPWGAMVADFHLPKQGCDVTAIGRVYSEEPRGSRSMDLKLRMGKELRCLRIWGPRVWERSGDALVPSQAQPFGMLDLVWAHSFGGSCLDAENQPSSYLFNPDGVGYQQCPRQALGQALAPIEDPRDPVLAWDASPKPCNLAAIPGAMPLNLHPNPAPMVESLLQGPRAELPRDFFNRAHPNFRFDSPRPGTPFSLSGMHVGEARVGTLPGEDLVAKFRLGDRRHEKAMPLTGLQFLPDSRHCIMNYSAHVAFRWVPQEQRQIRIETRPSRASGG